MNLAATHIILVRHGETDWNAEKRLQGHLDIGLNHNGIAQAEALASALDGEHLAAIYSSDLQRARATAHPLALRHQTDVAIDAQLRERCFGGFEGLRYDEIGTRFPEAYAGWQQREPDFRFPPGEREAETLTEFSARVLAAVGRIARAHTGAKIAIVTHGGVLDCIYRAATGMDLRSPRRVDMLNAAINRVVWHEGQLQLEQWGGVEHLAADARDEFIH